MGPTATVQLTGRDRAILRAVAGGSAELSGGSEPDLFLDGRSCCDQPAARRLAQLGLIAAGAASPVGRRAPAIVTPAGRALITAAGGGTVETSESGTPATADCQAVCHTPPTKSRVSVPARVITGCWRVRSSI